MKAVTILQMNKPNTQNTIRNWILDTVKKKIIYDIRSDFDTSIARQDDYLTANAFAMTVILRQPSRPIPVRLAQERLHKGFSDYYNKVLGHQCMNSSRLTTRNRKFLPMSFLAFDIEGTRNHGFAEMTTDPHGHGGILFHETTLENFKNAIARYLKPDGTYEITNPTREIALIALEPFDSKNGMEQFLHYALKFGVKLDNNNTNYCPDNFYPASSPNYPFWKTLQTDAYLTTDREHRKEKDDDTIEWLRNMATPNCRFRRNLGRDGGKATSRSPLF